MDYFCRSSRRAVQILEVSKGATGGEREVTNVTSQPIKLTNVRPEEKK
jgi:hypothetical protein